jgi:hypothetical protein
LKILLSDQERREKQQKNIAKAKLKMYVKDYLERLDRRILIGGRDSECKSLISFLSIFDTNSNSGDKNKNPFQT